MSSLKSVIITLPKGLPKAISTSDLSRNALPKLSLTTSFLADSNNKSKVETKKMVSIQSQEEDTVTCDDAAALFKPADACVMRGKKRRLDHLTWEEKLQRKKLKNRVAAQTSRDRKKAKLDELEETVRTLREKNELLVQECTILRSQNESLLSETRRLRRERDTRNAEEQQYCSLCQTPVGCAVPSLGSAVSPTDDPLPQGGTAQLASCLTLTPGAAVLLKILTIYLFSKSYLTTSRVTTTSSDSKSWLKVLCERLPQRWKRILIDQMNKENPNKQLDHSKTMVGQTSEDVEANRADRSVDASYLCEEVPSSSWHSVVCDTVNDSSCAVTTTVSAPIKTEIKTEIKQESEPTQDLEATLYGTYDEATKCIMIICPEEEKGGVGIQECVQEISTDGIVCHPVDDVASSVAYFTPPLSHSTQFSPPYTMSPASVHSDTDTDCCIAGVQHDCASLSDGGYESHDSPCADPHGRPVALTDFWRDSSFTELFPALA